VSGTKLGLIAMRQRAERLGGVLEVHSRAGRGTRITVTVPLNLVADNTEPAANEPPLPQPASAE
jgi:signal transduction histidine kinase